MGNKEDGKKNRGLLHLLSLECLQIFMSIEKRKMEKRTGVCFIYCRSNACKSSCPLKNGDLNAGENITLVTRVEHCEQGQRPIFLSRT
jgi:hypothetical protein